MGYITNFIVYTLAMVGVFVVALLVFKNATSGGCVRSSKHLKLIDSMPLGQRKTLYVVSAGTEQFLIAGDVNSTCLISKLNGLSDVSVIQKISNKEISDELNPESNSFQETLNSLPKQSYMDRRSNVGIRSSLLDRKSGNSVMKSLAERIKF